MTIEALQGLATAAVLAGRSGATRQGAGSPFEALLDKISSGDSGQTREVAAELLRVEMVQRSLSAPSEVQALETQLCYLCGGTPHHNSSSQAGSANNQAQPGTRVVDVDEISATAARFIGTPYRFGGEGEQGIDCSSFVQQVFGEHQIALPRTAREQIEVGRDVAAGELKKGDLLFFHTYASYPSHVGIYLGDGKMIHASSERGEVTVSTIDSAYYRSRFVGARRIG